MQLELSNEQIQTLLHLVSEEMAGFCGDIGYEELSKIKRVLEECLAQETNDETSD